MDSRNADILQIKKYLEGKLDTRAMYELERRALDDPFLMDAIEGYEAAGSRGEANAALDATLERRLHKPGGRIISLSSLALAASVITVLAIGGWWIFSRPDMNTSDTFATVEADKTEVSPSPLVIEPQILITKDSLLALKTPKHVTRSKRRTAHYAGTPMHGSDVHATSDETAEIASSRAENNSFLDESPVTMRSRAKTDSVPLNELVVMGFIAQQKRQTPQNTDKAVTSSQNIIKGKVVSANNGQPLPGVSIRAGDTPNFAVTGADGSYSIKVDSLINSLTYNYIGFNSKKLDIIGTPAPDVVVLEPTQLSLNEVVVASATSGEARPQNGWDDYQKYLNANSVSPNGKKGSYRVSFTVKKDGSLTNFQTNQADSDVAGQKAIQLIKNGPKWIGNAKEEEKKIITVEFKGADN